KQASYKADESNEFEIKDGLIASFLEERSAFVRGAVRQPGAYPVAYGTDMDAVIAAAGGITVEADPENIEVTSRMIPADEEADATATHRHTFSLANAKTAGVTIAPGDTIRL